ncbi:MAG: redox protein [Leptolyngbyaceae cyanobacterium SM1_1_3]|nr:redox protein [Leptolyngbyaceae cyanobacterium SM1_1_3]NJN04266.1 redox protein [Leptolyngbyaceae cyanobacterium RM1_1_2]NJO10003.1 redox protein [Leptolyngbyaceae cyanobacterium SL_1_1]
MFELVAFSKFRNTPNVRFFDITVARSNARDLVFHDGPAVSPNNSAEGSWQFYLHPHQEDNLLAVSGGRTFDLVNFAWDLPYHRVRLAANRDILRIPPGTFHRSVSDRKGSLVINQAVRSVNASVQSEFRVYNAQQIPRLCALLSSGLQPQLHGFEIPYLEAA